MKKGLVSKIMALLKIGDEGKLIRFESKLEKYLNKQITSFRDEMDNIDEKIVDAKEALNDAVLSVNTDSIQSADSVESYCVTYSNSLLRKLDEIDKLQDRRDEVKAKLEKVQSLIAAIEGAEAKTTSESK